MSENRTVTIRDVAKKAGVAVSTASRALGNGSASTATREKVRRAAEELHFIPNQAASSLASGRSDIVAIVVPEYTDFVFKDFFVAGVVSELTKAFGQRGMLPFLALTEPDDMDSLGRLLHDSGADGAVVLSYHYSDGLTRVLQDFCRPTVFVGKPLPHSRYPYVDVDNEGASYLAAEILAERGRRHIAVVAGPGDMPTPQQRTSGFSAGLDAHGMRPIAVLNGLYTAEHGRQACEQLLKQHPEVDGVFAQSDAIASGVMQVLRQHGKNIPKDVSIIGFDDFPIATEVSPALTTFAQPLHDMAAAVAEMLCWRLEHGEWNSAVRILPVSLIQRDSV